MTPIDAIAALDRQIAAHGQSITFKRGSTGQTARGFVRGFKPEQLVGLLTQASRQVTVSPSTLGSYVPRANDTFGTLGSLGTVIAAEPIHIGTTIVRWNITVTMT